MDSNSSTCIAGLLIKWDVAAIIWLVVVIYIVALNGQVFSITIGQRPISERFKFLPFEANLNSAPAIVFIGGVSRVITSGFHALPNAVKPIACHAVFQARLAELQVMGVLRFAMARLKTAAICRTALPEVIGENHSPFSAMALAEPESTRSSFLGAMDFMRTYDSPMTEGLVS